MTDRKTGTREEWLAARLDLLKAEKALTRHSDELAWRRQELSWVRMDKEYRFETDEGSASLEDLFGGRSQLLIYYDFGVAHTKEEWQSGDVEYNFRENRDFRLPRGELGVRLAEFASTVGTDWDTYRREGRGMSAFVREDGVVYHTYSAYERGIDGLWSMQQWLDRAPLGRNETGMWWRRHDEYDSQAARRRSAASPHLGGTP